MSLREWEEYRRRSTSAVLIVTTENNWSCSHRLIMEGTRTILPIMGTLWQLECFLKLPVQVATELFAATIPMA